MIVIHLNGFSNNFSQIQVENLAYQKEAWTNERKRGEKWLNKNSIRPRSFMNLIQEGHPSLAVDGNDENALHKCAIMDNYYTERPTLVINLERLTTIGGIVLKTWQGKGQGKKKRPYDLFMNG